MYICIWVKGLPGVCLWMYIYKYIYVYVCVCVYLYIYIYIYMCVCVCVCACVHVYVCMNVCCPARTTCWPPGHATDLCVCAPFCV